ncbi:MAG: hypothetical protein ACOCRO_05830 [Halanaerobiales bacterium]
MSVLVFNIMHKVSSLFFGGSMIGDVDVEWPTDHLSFLTPLLEGLQAALVPILIVAGTAGAIYSVVLGVNMARAETAEKREEAKKRIINTVVAMIITILLIVIFFWFMSKAPDWIGEASDMLNNNGE